MGLFVLVSLLLRGKLYETYDGSEPADHQVPAVRGSDRRRWELQQGIRTANYDQAPYTRMIQSATHASEEGEVREVAVTEQTGLVLRDTVADLGRRVDLWSRALERVQGVQLRGRNRVADPVDELAG